MMHWMIGIAFPLWLHSSVSQASTLQAGAAVRVVTPDPLLPVSGGIGTPRPVQTKKGDLTVRALVLEKGDCRVAICSADFLGFPGVLCGRVRDRVTGIPDENILIGSTHTHSAPDMYGFLGEDGRCHADLDYVDWVCTQMAEVIEEALQERIPVEFRVATDEAKGKIAYNYYAPQLYDPRMSVLQFLRKDDGKPWVTLVNYAIHPEVLGPKQGILSPDCIGPFYQTIQERGGGISLFMNGAQGGMITADCRSPNGDIQTWAECQRIGKLMAEEALRIVSEAPTQDDPELFCDSFSLSLPIESDLLLQVLETSPLGYKAPEKRIITQVNVLNLGPAQILTIPGEALPNVGFYLKRKMHGRHNLLFGLTNDALGYMLAKVDYDSFERYEYITRTCLGEMTAEIFMEESLSFLDDCPRPSVQLLENVK